MSYSYHLLHALQQKWKNLAILHMVIAQKEFTTLKEASTDHTRKKNHFCPQSSATQKSNKSRNIILSYIKIVLTWCWTERICFQRFVVINYSPPLWEMWAWIGSKNLSNETTAPKQSPRPLMGPESWRQGAIYWHGLSVFQGWNPKDGANEEPWCQDVTSG